MFLAPENQDKWDAADLAELRVSLQQFVKASGEALQVAVQLATEVRTTLGHRRVRAAVALTALLLPPLTHRRRFCFSHSLFSDQREPGFHSDSRQGLCIARHVRQTRRSRTRHLKGHSTQTPIRLLQSPARTSFRFCSPPLFFLRWLQCTLFAFCSSLPQFRIQYALSFKVHDQLEIVPAAAPNLKGQCWSLSDQKVAALPCEDIVARERSDAMKTKHSQKTCARRRRKVSGEGGACSAEPLAPDSHADLCVDAAMSSLW